MKAMTFPENSRVSQIIGRLVGLAIILGSIGLTAYISREHYRQPRTNDANVRANIVGIAPECERADCRTQCRGQPGSQ